MPDPTSSNPATTPIIDSEELLSLAREMLETVVDTVKGNRDRLSALDTAIENATDVVGRCSVGQELMYSTNSLKSLWAMRSEILETQTILFMASVKPLLSLIQGEIIEQAAEQTLSEMSRLKAAGTNDDELSDNSSNSYSLDQLTSALDDLQQQLDNPENQDNSDEPDSEPDIPD